MSARYRAEGLVMGCGRIGSALTPLSRKQSIELLQRSYDLGVRDFDTADIYGQGDSERFIGDAFCDRRHEVRIASKAGQRLSVAQEFASLFKGPIRLLAARREKVRTNIATHRARSLRLDFRAHAIRSALEKSLRRLRMEHLEIFYLHSPPPEVLKNDELVYALERMRAEGKFSHLGVSCDDRSSVSASLEWEPAHIVQFDVKDAPDGFGLPEFEWPRDKTLVLRGAFKQGRPAIPLQQLRLISGHSNLGGFVVGTTNARNLRSNVDLVDSFYGGDVARGAARS